MFVFAFSSKATLPVVHRRAFKRLFSAVVSLFLLSLLQANAGEPFKFIQFSDIHLGWGKHDSAGCVELAKKAGELDEKIEFVVVTGDLIDMGFKAPDPETLRLFHEFAKSFRVPVYCVPGNHDLSVHKKWEFDESEAARLVHGFQRHIGQINGVFECKGYRMVLFCELPLTKWCPRLEGYEPLAWLEKALSAEPRMPAMIFMHVPPDHEWLPERLAQWKDIVRRHEVKAVICGHLHADKLSWDGSIPVIAAYDCTNKHGDIPSFKVYSVDKDGKISYMTHYLRNH